MGFHFYFFDFNHFRVVFVQVEDLMKERFFFFPKFFVQPTVMSHCSMQRFFLIKKNKKMNCFSAIGGFFYFFFIYHFYGNERNVGSISSEEYVTLLRVESSHCTYNPFEIPFLEFLRLISLWNYLPNLY